MVSFAVIIFPLQDTQQFHFRASKHELSDILIICVLGYRAGKL